MESHAWRWVVALAAALLMMDQAGAAVPTLPDADAGAEFVRTARRAAYDDALAQYARQLSAEPGNAALAVARCGFIAQFVDDESNDWIESAGDDHENCLNTLRARWADAPEAQLYVFEQQWDEDALDRGEALLSGAGDWPDSLRRQLLVKLEQRYSAYKQKARAQELALEAARLGAIDQVPLAVEQLVKSGDQAAAAELLRSAPPANFDWEAEQRVEAALKLDDPTVALAELQRYQNSESAVSGVAAARTYLRVGDHAAARAALEDNDEKGEDARQVRFDTALAADDVALAIAQVRVNEARHQGANVQRLALLLGRWPSAAFEPTILGQLGWAGAILLVMALFPALVLVPVHYRGLQRRVAGRAALALFEPIGLRHAWWAMSLMLCTPFIVAGVLEPTSLAALFSSTLLPQAGPLMRITLWSALVELLLVLPLLMRMGWRGFSSTVPLARQLGWVLLALLTLYAVSYVRKVWIQHGGDDSATVQTQMVDSLINGDASAFGIGISFVVIALLGPILEEIVFRGLVLGGMARHIGFGWANLLQALMFAFAHNDMPRFIFYLTLGLLAGVLVKKTRSLTPGIALHGLNNALAFLALHH